MDGKKPKRKYKPRRLDCIAPGEFEGTITNGEHTLKVRARWDRGKLVVDAIDQNYGQKDGTNLDGMTQTTDNPVSQ